METLKVKVKKVITPATPAVTEERETEISLPFYSKIGKRYYKVPTENSCVEVDMECESLIFIRTTHIANRTPVLVSEATSGEIISAEEFESVYSKAMSLTNPDPIPTREEVESTETL